MTFGRDGGRDYSYDRETRSLLTDLRGLEGRRDYSGTCADALKLFNQYLEPVVDLYLQKDLGDDKTFLVKAKPWTETDFVALLQRHIRSFTEGGLPSYFERHVRQLEWLACRRRDPASTLGDALQYIAVMRSLVRTFPERIPVNAEDAIPQEEVEEAEEKLLKGREAIQEVYREIKDEALDEIDAERRDYGRRSYRHGDDREDNRYQDSRRYAPMRQWSNERDDPRDDTFGREPYGRSRDDRYDDREFGQRRGQWDDSHERPMSHGYDYRQQRDDRDRGRYRSRTDSPDDEDSRNGYGQGWNAHSPPERERTPFYRTYSNEGQRYNSGDGYREDGSGWGMPSRDQERYHDSGRVDGYSPRADAPHDRGAGYRGATQFPKRPPRRGAPQGPYRSASGGVPHESMTRSSGYERESLERSLSDADRAHYERTPSWEARGTDRASQRELPSGRKFSERQGFGRSFGGRRDFERSRSYEKRESSEGASRGSGWDEPAANTRGRNGWEARSSPRRHDRKDGDEQKQKEKRRSRREELRNSGRTVKGWGPASPNSGPSEWGVAANVSSIGADPQGGSSAPVSDNPWGSIQQEAPKENPWGESTERTQENPWGAKASEIDAVPKTEERHGTETKSSVVRESNSSSQHQTLKGTSENSVQSSNNPWHITGQQQPSSDCPFKSPNRTVQQDNPWGQVKTDSGCFANPSGQMEADPVANNPWAQKPEEQPTSQINPWAQKPEEQPTSQINPWAQNIPSQTTSTNPLTSVAGFPVVSIPMMNNDTGGFSTVDSAAEAQKDTQRQEGSQQLWATNSSTAALGFGVPSAFNPPAEQQNNPWCQDISSAQPSAFTSFARTSSAPNSLNDTNPWNSQAQQEMTQWNSGEAIWKSGPSTECSNFNSTLPFHKTEEEKHISFSSQTPSRGRGGYTSSSRRLKPPPGFETRVRRSTSMPHSSTIEDNTEDVQDGMQRMQIAEDDTALPPPDMNDD